MNAYNTIKAFGGYFGLELDKSKEYHDKAIRLNTGRNALEYILRARKYSKLYIPYYTCETVVEPLDKLDIPYKFYSINNILEPEFDFDQLNDTSAFLYTNYFGLKDDYIDILTKHPINIIIDNAQSFFSMPKQNIDTFYSARKFIGVPDGSYLYTNKITINKLPYDQSFNRISHLIKRIENGPEAGHSDFKRNDDELIGEPIKRMSKFTQSVLSGVNYDFVKDQRRENFSVLENALNNKNMFEIKLSNRAIPMYYPFLTDRIGLKQKLIENKIFVPTYWPNVFNWSNKNSYDYYLAENLISLPIDQRYDEIDMEEIINIINKIL